MPPIPVEVVTIMKDRLTGTTKKINQTIQQMRGGVEQSTTQMKKFSKGTLIASERITKTTTGLKRFQFEWLGVMFLGMAINKLFSQYIQQALEMLGITELFTEALKYMIFMALEPLLPIMYDILSFFFDLPVPMQRAIGWFILFAGVAGLLLMMFGQLMLGILSLKLVFAGLPIAALIAKFGVFGGVVKALGGFFAGLGGIIAAIAGVIIAIAAGMFMAWKENFLGMKNVMKRWVEAIKGFYKGLFEHLALGIKLITALLTGDFKTAKETIVELWKNGVEFIKNFFKGLGSSIVAVFIGIIRFLKLLIIDFGLWLTLTIVKLFSGLFGKFSKFVGFAGLGFGGEFGDFIWRPGSPPIEVSPRDTIVGFKGAGPAGASINFAPTYNIHVADKGEFENLIKQNNVRLIEDLRRMVQD